jgi:hypothetical protein
LAKDRHVARFIEPMECLPVEKIPEGDLWSYESKLDGCHSESREIGWKGHTLLPSRNWSLTAIRICHFNQWYSEDWLGRRAYDRWCISVGDPRASAFLTVSTNDSSAVTLVSRRRREILGFFS